MEVTGVPSSSSADLGPNDLPRRAALLILTAIVVFGASLRLASLGNRSLSGDEALHVFAARRVVESGRPELPSGDPYVRALPFTYLVASSFRLFGAGEDAARLPSAVAGTLAIVAVYALGSSLFGRTAGLIAAALQAFTPDAVALSRFARTYALAQLLVILTTWGVYLAVQGKRLSGYCRQSTRGLGAFLAVASLLATASLQREAYAIVLPFGLYLGVLTGLSARESGLRVAARTGHARMLAAGVVVCIAVMAAAPDGVAALWIQIRTPLPWVDADAFSVAAYHYYLTDHYGWLWVVAPACTLCVLVTAFPRALLPAFVFWVPLVALSTVVPTQGPHHLAPFLPFLFILEAEAGRRLTLLVWERLSRMRRVAEGLAFHGKARAGVFVAAGWLGALILSPWLTESVKTPFAQAGSFSGARFDGWRTVAEALRSAGRGDEAIVANSELLALYYLGRVDARLLVRAQRPHGGDRDAERTPHGWRYLSRTTRSPSSPELADLLRTMDRYSRGWVVLERWRVERRPDPFAPGVSEFLSRCLGRLPIAGEESINVYTWDLARDPRGCAERVTGGQVTPAAQGL